MPLVHIYQQKGSLFKVCNGSTQALRNQMQYQFMNSMIREMNIVVIVGGDTWVHNKSVAFLFSGYFKGSDKKGENSNYSTTRSSSKIFRVVIWKSSSRVPSGTRWGLPTGTRYPTWTRNIFHYLYWFLHCQYSLHCRDVFLDIHMIIRDHIQYTSCSLGCVLGNTPLGTVFLDTLPRMNIKHTSSRRKYW